MPCKTYEGVGRSRGPPPANCTVTLLESAGVMVPAVVGRIHRLPTLRPCLRSEGDVDILVRPVDALINAEGTIPSTYPSVCLGDR